MFVSDSNIFTSSKMRLRITWMDGTEVIGEFSPEMTVDKLKIEVLPFFTGGPLESAKNSLYHKLILSRTRTVLQDEKSLQEQGVFDNDELLLLKRHLGPSQFEKTVEKSKFADDVMKGPSTQTIKKATSEIPSSGDGSTPVTSTVSDDFQTELRRILISLLEVSQKLLCLNPEASRIFKQAEELVNERSSVKKVDELEVKQLIDMGFPRNRALKALHLNKLSVMAAMEWLLVHQEDADIDTPVPGMEEEEEEGDELKTEELSGATGEMNSTGTSVDGATAVTRPYNLLHSLRAYRKREFKPNQKALRHLTEMGFDVKDATEALRISRNDCDSACEWLLGDRRPQPEEVDEGLDMESPIFKAIMANPTVQLGLNNPRCLLAFIQILEHPHMASQWLNDPETAPLLVQVSRIYHSEKNSDQNYQAAKQKKGAAKETDASIPDSSTSSSYNNDSEKSSIRR